MGSVKRSQIRVFHVHHSVEPGVVKVRSSFINGRCDRCLSDSSPVVVTTLMCSHKFCGKCFICIWSYQKLGEPCICPIDGERLIWLRPDSPYVPQDINALVRIYNRYYNPKTSPARLVFVERNLTWLYYLDTAIVLAGAIAYCIKLS
ncbi:hypothetical protein EUTSA_v10001754mg [Eutrema salsugineum]|uniref:RING-type domain-containing protein n=1 Tax=Eutrema salsugineum TaxID=72664 RepID=V4L9V4_EUTSA|nr:hypothetical protein EUTSA_v10001754mg [Eutrema salsugineum]